MYLLREADEAVSNKLKPICKTLFLNNRKTGNFPTLLKYVAAHSSINDLISNSTENDRTYV